MSRAGSGSGGSSRSGSHGTEPSSGEPALTGVDRGFVNHPDLAELVADQVARTAPGTPLYSCGRWERADIPEKTGRRAWGPRCGTVGVRRPVPGSGSFMQFFSGPRFFRCNLLEGAWLLLPRGGAGRGRERSAKPSPAQPPGDPTSEA